MSLSVHHRTLVRALARTLFTRERAPEIDGDDAGVAVWFDDWLAALPPLQRAAVTGALDALDVAYRAWAGRPGEGFAHAPAGERAAFCETCATSAPWAVRQVFEALRLSMIAAYVDSPAVAAAIGVGDVVALARARAGATA